MTPSASVPAEVQNVQTSASANAPLTANDRCDRCGAQAYMRTAHRDGDLLWCAHHARDHHDALANHVVTDETDKLVVDEAARLT